MENFDKEKLLKKSLKILNECYNNLLFSWSSNIDTYTSPMYRTMNSKYTMSSIHSDVNLSDVQFLNYFSLLCHYIVPSTILASHRTLPT